MKQGFSLVELSIVLVILGLLTGGILTGQSLIRAAELRSVTTEFQRYQTATHTFRDKYLALPGDMRSAQNFWPTSTNGNGDGRLLHAPAVNAPGEYFGAWQQMAFAGLIEGSYSGLSGPGGGDDHIAGTNTPAGRISNSGWSFEDQGVALVSNLNRFEGTYNHTLYFGRKIPNGDYRASGLTPEEMWNIDTKVDDGLPGTGSIVSLESNCHASAGCCNPAPSTTIPASTFTYDLDFTTVICGTIFKLGW